MTFLKRRLFRIFSHQVIYFEIYKKFNNIQFIGQGGYISAYKPRGMKFSAYIKMRMQSRETSFRRNQAYVFFLACIKDRCQVRSMTSIYFRKAYKTPGLGKKTLSGCNLADLKRYKSYILEIFVIFTFVKGLMLLMQFTKICVVHPHILHSRKRGQLQWYDN